MEAAGKRIRRKKRNLYESDDEQTFSDAERGLSIKRRRSSKATPSSAVAADGDWEEEALEDEEADDSDDNSDEGEEGSEEGSQEVFDEEDDAAAVADLCRWAVHMTQPQLSGRVCLNQYV